MGISEQNTKLFERLLKKGKSLLYLELGIVSRVNGDNYELIAIDDISNEYKPGDILNLNNTYCREVIATGKTVALIEYEKAHGLRKHPLYTVKPLEAYIGAPVHVNGNIWGLFIFHLRSFALLIFH